MIYENILFQIDVGVARLTLNRPDRLNSFSAAMHAEVRDAIAQVTRQNGARCLLITGAGRGFCAGQDLADPSVGDDLGETVRRDYAPLVRSLRALPMPVVCAVNGVAAGAGANLAFACDIVVAKHSASFLEPFCKLSLVPDTGGTYFLPRLAGTARAMGLAMLGEKISALQAADWGLIWKCVADDTFDAEVEKLVAQLAAAPTLALARMKREIYAAATATLDEQLMAEADAMRDMGHSRDFREGVEAFLNKRTPVFRGE